MVMMTVSGDEGGEKAEPRTWIERELFERRWSVREFGRQIGVSATHAGRLAQGERPSTRLCHEIARVFGMTHLEVLRRVGHVDPLPDDYEEHEEVRLLEILRELESGEREELLQFARFLHARRNNSLDG
jgi:transcriptional regulator with XRE-family HTH domain